MLHDILVDLLPKVDLGVRRELSRQLSTMEKPPVELLSLLVHDVIEVSGPLLEQAPVSEGVLIDVVEHDSDAHREKVSRRHDLSTKVQQALDHAGFGTKARALKGTTPQAAVAVAETHSALAAEIAAASTPPPEFRSAETLQAPTMAEARRRIFEDITRSTADWTWETGRLGQITFLSPSAIRAFGRPAQMMTGFYLSDYCLVHETSRPFEDLNEILERRRPFRDIPVVTRDAVGQQRRWLLSGVACFDPATERFTGYRGTAQEIASSGQGPRTPLPEVFPVKTGQTTETGPQSTTASLTDGMAISPITAKMDKAVAETIENLSHELRTPLNAILGFSEMIDLETWGPVNPAYHDQAQRILKSANHLKTVITDVLEVAKIRAGKHHITPKFFSLGTVINTSIDTARKDVASQTLVQRPDLGQAITLLNDPDLLKRCLTKILSCLISHGLPGETLSLTARRTADRRVTIDAPVPGRPIASEKLRIENIGRPNFEVSNDETSMAFALSIAADLARSIGGEIDLVSDGGQTRLVRLIIGDYPAGAAATTL